jgi:hypothetical protein
MVEEEKEEKKKKKKNKKKEKKKETYETRSRRAPSTIDFAGSTPSPCCTIHVHNKIYFRCAGFP